MYVAKIKTSCKIEGLNQPISKQAVENMNKNGQLRAKLCNQVRSLDHFVVQNSRDFLC